MAVLGMGEGVVVVEVSISGCIMYVGVRNKKGYCAMHSLVLEAGILLLQVGIQ
jgi:hypothetical protein